MRKKSTHIGFRNLLVFVFLFALGIHSVYGASDSSLADYAELRRSVGLVADSLTSGAVEPSAADAVAEQIETISERLLFQTAKKTPRTARRSKHIEMIKKVLTPDLYAALQSACVSGLTSKDEDVQAAAFRLLARSLRSDAAEEWMQTRLLRALEYLELKGDVLDAPFSFQELFLLAEGLAYIDNMEGLPVLKSAAMGEDRSSSIRTRAIEAFAILGGDFSDEPLSELLMLEDALAAYTAFEYVALARPNRAVTSAAVHHLVRLQRGLSKKGEFSDAELARILHEKNSDFDLSQ